MDHNPYAPPQAEVKDTQAALEIPDDILKKIKGAWIAGVLSGCITLALALWTMTGASIPGWGPEMIIDAGLAFGLAYGIYRKSRTCAVILLAYFVISKVMIISETARRAASLSRCCSCTTTFAA
jgi:hypothetical protein